jgi:branched-chain amino acid transport system permease protein
LAPFVAILVAMLLNMGLAVLVALPAVRVKGEYLLLLSLGFAAVTYELLLNLVDLTGGPMGLTGISSLGQYHLFGLSIDLGRKSQFIWLAGFVVLVAVILAAALRQSSVGRTFRAVRDDPEVAAATGINVISVLIVAFTISAAFASVAGSLYAHYLRILDPGSFTILLSVEVLLMCVIGGRDSTWGPLFGAFLVVGLPEIFRPFAEYRLVVFGVCIVLVIVFLPNGLVGLPRAVAALVHRQKTRRL